ncbi:hypothetical protein BC940DRAFT_304167 [Gongronella butleri]|nr:hypothetical protein BC940DRAFT_304167 [Gongronella butleri]
MYNVPYQVADYTAEPAQQPQNSTNDRYPQAGHPPSSLAPPPTGVAGAIDPSSLTTHGLANHHDQDGVKKDNRASSFSYIPLNAPSPIPSNSSVAKAAGIHPTDTSTADKHHARSASLNYDMYSPSPTFKRPSSAERKDDALYYPPPNDPWMAGATGANAQTQDDDDDEPTSVLDDGSVPQQHMQQLFEKKRRRRESHNAVERRRRDNINERIYELSTMHDSAQECRAHPAAARGAGKEPTAHPGARARRRHVPPWSIRARHPSTLPHFSPYVPIAMLKPLLCC